MQVVGVVDHSECYFIVEGITLYVVLHTIEHLFHTFELWMLYFKISCGPLLVWIRYFDITNLLSCVPTST